MTTMPRPPTSSDLAEGRVRDGCRRLSEEAEPLSRNVEAGATRAAILRGAGHVPEPPRGLAAADRRRVAPARSCSLSSTERLCPIMKPLFPMFLVAAACAAAPA
ncbi:MAG: hypothetical protein HXY24_05680, partial [Rubrivivax sp.]|nr:hypothetical protein [Rubrivivax sp.]